MARDPVVQHAEAELQEGLALVRSGDDLSRHPAVREELVFLGLLREDETGQLHMTPEGRKLLG
jgi:hypothetical protein